MNERQTEMWDLLCDLEAETVLNLLTDYHGLQLLDDGFYDHLIGEGYIEEPVPVIEDEDEDEEMFDYEEALRQRPEAIKEGNFDMFCSTFNGCVGCPFDDAAGDCLDLFKVWLKERAGGENDGL